MVTFLKTLLPHAPLHMTASSYKMSLTLNTAPENNPDIQNSGGEPTLTEDYSDTSDLVKCQFINTVCYYKLHRSLRTRSRATGCKQMIQNILELSSYLVIDGGRPPPPKKTTSPSKPNGSYTYHQVQLTMSSALFSNHTASIININ